jgi:menaquinone-specific isochorismate synthase
VFASETNQAKRELLELAIRRSQSLRDQVLFSFTERMEPCSLTELFARAGTVYGGSRFFWSEPHSDHAFVAFGVALEVGVEAGDERYANRYARVEQRWTELMARAVIGGEEPGDCGEAGHTATADAGLSGPLLVGGFSFDPRKHGGEIWRNFPDSRFVLPTFVVSIRDGEARLTFSRMIDPASDSEAEWKACEGEWIRFRRMFESAGEAAEEASAAASTAASGAGFREASREAFGGTSGEPVVTLTEIAREEWLQAVEQGVRAVRSNRFEKVVLARMCLLEKESPFDLRQVLETLRSNQPGTYVFAFESGESCFVGATPERLVKREDGQFITLSLAGTAPRGETPAEDENIGRYLLSDHKNRLEHDLAVRMIADAMSRLCDEIEMPGEPILYKLKDVQHLQTPIRGKAKEGATLLQAVEMLHPTPALGGKPREAAMEFIREFEPTDRGWYAAPIGWMNGRLEGEFVAGIRSALVRNDRAVLFAGCGIVGDSVPDQEYAETVIKFRPMIAALTGSRQVRMADQAQTRTGHPGAEQEKAEQVEAK